MRILKTNFILNVDSYKSSHYIMISDDIIGFESSIVARKPSKFTNEMVMMGLQYYLKEYLDIIITKDDVDEAEYEVKAQGQFFNREMWDYIVEHYNGKIPLQIRAVPEGTVVPAGVPMVRVMSTDPKAAIIASYIETQIQRAVWYPSTVATVARSIKSFLSETMMRHAGHDNVSYHVHNFGDRGSSTFESAILAGISHATQFSGSDCLSANRYIKAIYDTKKNYISSVVASEHSATCSNSNASKRDDFGMAVKMVRIWEKMVDAYIKNGSIGAPPIVAAVIDTYDAKRFAREFIGTRLKSTIVDIASKCPGAKFVLRPDSGNPVTMPIEIIEILMDTFGYSVNKQGMKVLPSYIGVIQGDGINEQSIRDIVQKLDEYKFSLENIIFGMGGKLVHPPKGRDEFSYAMKSTAQEHANGEWEDLFKDPITDIGKRSLRGRVTTFKCTQSGKIFADRVGLQDVNPFIEDMMVDVYYNGVITNLSTFDQVIERCKV